MSDLTFQEQVFAQELCRTSDPVQSYATAYQITAPFSYVAVSRDAFALADDPRIQALVKAIRDRKDVDDPIDKDWVKRNLRTIVERSMTAEPVRTKDGEVVGQFTFQANAATKALELLGKELKMFKEHSEVDVNFSDPNKLAAALETAKNIAKGSE